MIGWAPDREFEVLILEDSPRDADLVELELRRGGLSFVSRRADSRDSFASAFDQSQPDLVLADFALPSYDGVEALEFVRKIDPDLPFILVSGYIGKERAIEAFESGVTDIVLKDRLGRLVPSVKRAIREIDERIERERLEEDLRSLRDHYAHLARVNDLGEMAAGIAHELNQPLTAIINYLAIGSGGVAGGGDDEIAHCREAMALAARQALRAGEIIRRLRQFIGRGDGQSECVSANELIDTAISFLTLGPIDKQVDIERVPSESDIVVAVQPVQIQQVIMNLLRNALEAFKGEEPGRKVQIGVSLNETGTLALFEVFDNGTGIPPEMAARIFEPFASSKPRGMGIGLTLCKRIVEAHGGTIEVDSEPGIGTTFRFSLPTAPEGSPA